MACGWCILSSSSYRAVVGKGFTTGGSCSKKIDLMMGINMPEWTRFEFGFCPSLICFFELGTF